ncbi:hypothetical protein [Nonomuraea dietziae]|uniref:hypothetical protein n=1 Tax=Nonomuraea dietziae TaxID=65515 RepID=UPI0031DA6956
MHLVDAAAVRRRHQHVGEPAGRRRAADAHGPLPLPPARARRSRRAAGGAPDRAAADLLRRDRAANLRAAPRSWPDEQRRLGAPRSAPTPVAWHGALTRYANAGFANEVEVLREGAGRRPEDGSAQCACPATAVPAFRNGRGHGARVPPDMACE